MSELMKRAIDGQRSDISRTSAIIDDFPVIPIAQRVDRHWRAGVQLTRRSTWFRRNRRSFERCILMATDPGDLVLDPTCGSGTTAYVAEQWGRRWITIDTSRVALALARARIMGARYPYYLLADSREGQLKEAEVTRDRAELAAGARQHPPGFVYERVPHITLKSIANNAEIDVIWDKWQAKLEPLREALNAALEEDVAGVGDSARGRCQVAGRGEEAARRLVAGAHRPPEGDRRVDRRQGRVRVPLRQALRGQGRSASPGRSRSRASARTACSASTRTTS